MPSTQPSLADFRKNAADGLDVQEKLSASFGGRPRSPIQPNAQDVMEVRKEGKELLFSDLAFKETLDMPNNTHEFRTRERVQGVTMTIDSYGSSALDDGLSFRREDDGTLVIGVSITDVGAWIKRGTALDMAARRRVENTYEGGYVQPMLPFPLSTDVLSLHGSVERLTKTLEMRFTNDGELLDTHLFRSVFYNQNRIDKKAADKAIDAEGMGKKNPELADALQQIVLIAGIIEGKDKIPSASSALSTFNSFTGEIIAKKFAEAGIEASFRNQPKRSKPSSYGAKPDGHASHDGAPYVQWTSPIRRYTDLDTHRAIDRLIDNKPFTGRKKEISHNMREIQLERANHGRSEKLNIHDIMFQELMLRKDALKAEKAAEAEEANKANKKIK